MNKKRQIPQGAIAMLERGFVWESNSTRWKQWFGKLFRIYQDLEIAQTQKHNDELLAIIVVGKHGQFNVGYVVYNPCILPKEDAERFRNKKPGPKYLRQKKAS